MNTFQTQAREFIPSNIAANPFVPTSTGLTTTGKPFVPSFDAKPFIPSQNLSLPVPMATPAAGNGQGGFYKANMAQGLYKTEICKNWIENGYCRYAKKCQFAHGNKQLVQPVFAPAMADLQKASTGN